MYVFSLQLVTSLICYAEEFVFVFPMASFSSLSLIYCSCSFILLLNRNGSDNNRASGVLSISSTLSHLKKYKAKMEETLLYLTSISYSFILFAINYVMKFAILICFYYILILISFDFIDKESGLEHLNLRKGSL